MANTVLSTVSKAMDAAEGTGRGQAALQILLDGCPANYQALFTNLVAGDDGTLQDDHVLRNMHKRPPTEHRRLLNQGLLNLIERALSLAVEELPDEAIDELEAIIFRLKDVDFLFGGILKFYLLACLSGSNTPGEGARNK